MNNLVGGSENSARSTIAADYKMESGGRVRILSSSKKFARFTEPHPTNVSYDYFLKQKCAVSFRVVSPYQKYDLAITLCQHPKTIIDLEKDVSIHCFVVSRPDEISQSNF